MYISETKLRKIIRSEIINESYTPKSAYDEAVYHIKGSEENTARLVVMKKYLLMLLLKVFNAMVNYYG